MRPSPQKRDRGFTLVELMVALVLGLLVVAGVLSVFLGMRASYGFQEGLSRVQENGRFAVQTLGRELRQTGFTGCTNNIFNWVNPAGAGYVESVFGDRPVTGWEAAGTDAADDYTIGDATAWQSSTGEAVPGAINNPLPGSDIIILNSSEPLDITLDVNPADPANAIGTTQASGVPKGAIILAVRASCAGGDQWMNVSNPSSKALQKGSAAGITPGNINPAGGFSQEHDDDSIIYQHTSTAYFVRNNASVPAEPALYRLRLDEALAPGGAPNPQELVAGVENMQILYGEDTNDDDSADTYVDANAVADWDRVVSVRLGLLLRNNTFVQSESDLRAFDVAYTNVTPTEPDRVRQVMTLTVALRNQLP